jgi:hypothetical protein
VVNELEGARHATLWLRIVRATRYARVVNDARRTDPFLPGAIGWMRGTLYVAYTNWERLEVRDELNRVAFAFEPQSVGSRWLLSDPLFTTNHLLVAKSSHIVNQGFWAWDWDSQRQVLSETFLTDGRPFFCQPHGTNALLARDPKGIAVWDLHTARRRRLVPCEQPSSAALHPRTRRLAYQTYGQLHVVSEGGLPSKQWSAFGDWESLAWGLDGRVLIGVPVNRGALVIDPESGEHAHELPILGDILATSDDGRWVAFQRGLVDLQSMTVREHDARIGGTREAQAAAFDPTSNQFALVGGPFIWRVPV